MGVGIGTASANRDHMQESRFRQKDGKPGSASTESEGLWDAAEIPRGHCRRV